MTQNNRKIGSHYEDKVAAFLEQRGYVILERNFRCRIGEIDLIARDGAYLVFIEVKYRKNTDIGTSLEAIDRRKAARIRKVAEVYLYQNHFTEYVPCRFDAAGIDGEQVTYIKNAF